MIVDERVCVRSGETTLLPHSVPQVLLQLLDIRPVDRKELLSRQVEMVVDILEDVVAVLCWPSRP